ncbi:hypothetical protein B296_00058538 [Ensete ventricosum]|uniref:Epidermal patterning factor-like protein n=1 Tax=Ensete ventricosum TaxID=4639 RepID=A0A426X4H2_ENSVE|nr:hypothetical protein B296_00058538 [Ensete ventricosum]
MASCRRSVPPATPPHRMGWTRKGQWRNEGEGIRRSAKLIWSASVVIAQEAGDTGLRLWEKENRVRVLVARRRLGGPGSSPPICRARCGRCLPCRPVHMAIQPGRSFPLEYYPEAWRCKCGGKLFMP